MNPIASLLLSLRDPTIINTLSNVEVQDRIKTLLNITSGGGGLINSVNDTATVDLTVGVSGNLSANFINSAGYVTPSSVAAFTNKSGNISQWTNDSGYITSASAGAMEYVSTATASTSATIDFTGFVSGYDYVVSYRDVVLSANTAIYIRVGTGVTPTWEADANDYGFVYTYSQGTGAPGTIGATGQTYIDLAWGNTFDSKNACADVKIFNPSCATLFKNIQYHASYNSSSSGAFTSWTNINGSGFFRSTTAVTGLRFYPSTGTITSGTFTLYRIKIS